MARYFIPQSCIVVCIPFWLHDAIEIQPERTEGRKEPLHALPILYSKRAKRETCPAPWSGDMLRYYQTRAAGRRHDGIFPGTPSFARSATRRASRLVSTRASHQREPYMYTSLAAIHLPCWRTTDDLCKNKKSSCHVSIRRLVSGIWHLSSTPLPPYASPAAGFLSPGAQASYASLGPAS